MKLKRVGDFEWEIPVGEGMNVPGRVFASEEILDCIKKDRSLEQVGNVAKLPGVLRASYVMPDAHQGYGFPIGGVAAFDVESGVISPSGVGYDINCSVRLLKTNLKRGDLEGREKEILHSLFRAVPSGVGCRGKLRLSVKELDEVLVGGAEWAVENGYGKIEDCLHIEDGGKMNGADVGCVSQKAKGRGMSQLGSLGAGNHFLDVLVVDEVFDKKIAGIFGLEKEDVVIMIHCGSRGLGHQIASDYIKEMSEVRSVDGSSITNRRFTDMGLTCAPIDSDLGQKYLSAMRCAANFAFANKQIISHLACENMRHYFPNFEAKVVCDICHNIAKFEKHIVQGLPVSGREETKEVLVVRKGATRSFGPGRVEISEDYRKVGQPALIPGSMGTASYVMCGTRKAEEISWGSMAHGAGRVKSRTQAKKDISFDEAKKDMEKRGVFVESGGEKGWVEESPFSYKDVDEVVRILHESGLGKRVARLNPILVAIG